MEFPIAHWTRADVDKTIDKRQFVDIVVTGEGLPGDDRIWSALPTHTHPLFAEVKWFPRGSGTRWRFDHLRKVAGVNRDARRLARHLELGRCRYAAVFVAGPRPPLRLAEPLTQLATGSTALRLFVAHPTAREELAAASP
jgi:hypothetical protein